MNDEIVLPDRTKFASAAEYAYAALRREIVEGRFAPGRRMREVELAEHLGISRTPTRQALTRLELEGLLDLRPRTGLVVSVLDMDAVEELYEMRAALEGTAAAMAAKHASPKDLAALDRLVAEGEKLDRVRSISIGITGNCMTPFRSPPTIAISKRACPPFRTRSRFWGRRPWPRKAASLLRRPNMPPSCRPFREETARRPSGWRERMC